MTPIAAVLCYNMLMPMAMDINAVKEQMHIKDSPGYAFLDAVGQTAVMPEDVEQAWMSEIERRRADYKAGRVQLVDGEEVFRKAMSKYA